MIERTKSDFFNRARLQKLYRKFRYRHKKFVLSLSPQQNLIYGFGVYAFFGWLLLCLPFGQKQSVSFLDNLFLATSAISTTGLVTVSVSDTYNFIGQLILLILIQIGGVGYMTFSSFIILSRRNRITHRKQKILMAEFSMPKNFELKDFLKSVILFTIIAETIGAIFFYYAFRAEGLEPWFAVWSSIFHSVSAFCTAGFGLYNNSFEDFAGSLPLNAIISTLAILGSLGFIVVTDIWYRIRGKSNSITFTTRVIVIVLLVLLTAGTLMFYFNSPGSISSSENRLITSFFQSMTAITTVGFNTIPVGNLSLPLLLFTVFLMYVGASPSGTGGGLKSTTLTAILSVVWCRFRGYKRVSFIGRIIPIERLYIATTTFIFYSGMIVFIVFLLSYTENFTLIEIIFETASALGTVGLSMGITPDLSALGKLILIFTMFLGRLGILTFGLSVLARKSNGESHKLIEDLAV